MSMFIFLRKILLFFVAILATGCASDVRLVNQKDMETTHPLITQLGSTKEDIISKYGAPHLVFEKEDILIYHFSDIKDKNIKDCKSYEFILKFKDNHLVKTGMVCKE